MFHEFTDYHGPTGPYVATGTKILSFGTAEGMAAVAQSAMLTSLGASPAAEQYAQAVVASLALAHEADDKTHSYFQGL
jgi:hypothetical protein